MCEMRLPLPAAVDGFVAGVNAADVAAALDAFAGDALVNDLRRERRGRAAIGRWLREELVGTGAVLSVLGFREHYGDVIATGRMDRTGDAAGLSDPLILTLYFTLRLAAEGDRIVQLIVVDNGPAAAFARPVRGGRSGFDAAA